MRELKLEQIKTDGNTQPRVSLNKDAVAEYAEAWKRGDDLPPLVVFHDGAEYFLAEGFHRLFGAKQAELLTVPCDVRKGTVIDARQHAAASNATHGLKRTNADKRKAVGMMLEDHPDWSDRKIAEHCVVGHPLVAECRAELQVEEIPPEKPKPGRTGKDGKTYKAPEPKIAPLARERLEAAGVEVSSAEKERLAELPPQQQRQAVDLVIAGEARTVGGAIGKVDPTPAPAPSIVLDAIKRPIPKHLTEKHATAAHIMSAATKLDAAKQAVEKLAEQVGAEFLSVSEILEAIKAVKRKIMEARYWSECPRCKGKVNKKCDRCGGHGYLPYARKGTLSADDKAYLGVE